MKYESHPPPSTSRCLSRIAEFTGSPPVRILAALVFLFLAVMLQKYLVNGLVARFEDPVFFYLQGIETVINIASLFLTLNKMF